MPPVSPARAVAYDVVRRVFERGAYADRALHGAARDLDPRDRALAGALVYGTVQRKGTLDALAASLVNRSLTRLEPAVLNGLRLGLYQLLFLDGVADHAAVNETVALIKPHSLGGAGLANAVLRRAAREGEGWLAQLRDDTPQAAALAHSLPEWLAHHWFDELGPDDARSLMAAVNRPAESALRVNTLTTSRDTVAAALPVTADCAPGLPEGLVLQGAFDAFGSELWQDGAIMPQSRGSMLVSRVLAPEPGADVLDLCAAPGAKTTHLAALGAQRVVAVERNAKRAEGLRETAARMHASVVSVRELDAAIVGSPVAPVGLGPEDGFDAVLVDPPCSGLGTLQSRPDIRWHAGPEQIAQLAVIQAGILSAAARVTRPGGALVYSVCTISRAEGPAVVEAFLSAHPEFAPDPLAPRHPEYAEAATGPYLQLRPDSQGTDGFFIARLRRA
jgi:16S rRNA (cytosine967-C5)-methyltransferase